MTTKLISDERMEQIANRLNCGENFTTFDVYDECLTHLGDAAKTGCVMVLTTGQHIEFDGNRWEPGWDTEWECQCMLCGKATPVTEMEEHCDQHMCDECAEAEGWHK